MFSYKGVLHAGKYYGKPIIKHCNTKNNKIKLKRLLNEKRKLDLKIARLKSYIEHEENADFPFLL